MCLSHLEELEMFTFSSDLGIAKDVPFVDGALAYGCPFKGFFCVLVVKNALHVPSMEMSPFIMRAGGTIANDVPKIHNEEPTVDNHCVLFDNSDLQIPLQLNRVFSYFHTRVPTERNLMSARRSS